MHVVSNAFAAPQVFIWLVLVFLLDNMPPLPLHSQLASTSPDPPRSSSVVLAAMVVGADERAVVSGPTNVQRPACDRGVHKVQAVASVEVAVRQRADVAADRGATQVQVV